MILKEYPQIKEIIWVDKPDQMINDRFYQARSYLNIRDLFEKGGVIYLINGYTTRGFSVEH